MSKPKTHVAFVIDRSGSMWKTAQQAVDGFNGQVAEVIQNAKDHDIRASLITFNGEVYEHLWEASAEELKPATHESFHASGWTAMYDAVGYAIDKLIQTTDTEEKGATYMVIVISDGEENHSKHYQGAHIKSLIEECESTGKWTFTYMGCNPTYLKQVAQTTGIKLDNMAAWENKTKTGTRRALRGTQDRMKNYFGGKLALKDSNDFVDLQSNFYSDDDACVADYACADTAESQEAEKLLSLDASVRADGGTTKLGAPVGSINDPAVGNTAKAAWALAGGAASCATAATPENAANVFEWGGSADWAAVKNSRV